jgi:hypothetical protein
LIVSVQLPAAQSLLEQIPLRQSDVLSQALLSAHLPQLPPQSTSVSDPSFTASEQEGIEQTLPMHVPLLQSEPTKQAFPVRHLPHVAPPQSTSVSAPFLTLSVHVGVGFGVFCSVSLPQDEIASSKIECSNRSTFSVFRFMVHVPLS